MPPEASVSVCPEPRVNVAAAAVLNRRLLTDCVFQAVVLAAWKSTLAAAPGAVVAVPEGV